MLSVWNFPGGKIEQNELAQDAINREIKEELCVNCVKSELMFSGDFVFDNVTWRGYYFKCVVDSYDFVLEYTKNSSAFFDIGDICNLKHGIPNDVIKKLA